MTSDAATDEEGGEGVVGHVSLGEIAAAFALIGVSSFGGGLSGWMYRELVEKRRWLTAYDFLAGLSLARTLPGVNTVNLSIWVGYRLRKTPGALTAALSALAGPFVIILILGASYRYWSQSPVVHWVLLGVASAALGISLSLGVKTLRIAARTWIPALIVAVLFVAIGVLRWPLLPVVAVLGPVSIAWGFLSGGEDER